MQTLLPIADVTSNGRYFPVGAASFFDAVDDASGAGDGDATYCRKPETESDSGFFRVQVGTGTDPLSYMDHVVKALVRGVEHGDGLAEVTMNIQQQGESFSFTGPVQALTTSYALYEFPLSAKQVSQFNGYADLWLTCSDNAAGGQEVRWTRVWLEVPDPMVPPGPGETEVGGINTPNPLLDPNGFSWLSPVPPLVRIERANGTGAVLATDTPGGRRETRQTHERAPRVYRVIIDPMRGFEAEIVRQALVRTRGGAMWTRWRPPDDPPPSYKGDIMSAPRWRVLNAGIDADFTLERGRGGGAGGGRMEIVLEEV